MPKPSAITILIPRRPLLCAAWFAAPFARASGAGQVVGFARLVIRAESRALAGSLRTDVIVESIQNIRRIVVIAAVSLAPTALWAQNTVLTVAVESAEIYKAPTTASPIIGHSPRGTALIVTRELGSWVKISWPDAQDGVGYVHVTRGTVKHGDPERVKPPEPAAPRPPESASPPRARAGVRADMPAAGVQPAPLRPVYVSPSTHVVGLGGRLSGEPVGGGISARVWSRPRLGVELEMFRSAISSVDASQRATSTEFEPSVLFALSNHVSDYVWVRPYVGSGVSFGRQTLSIPNAPDAAVPATESKTGFQVFAGGEFTFAAVPRFALSAEVGHRWIKTSFTDVNFGGPSFSVSGHWYVK